MPDCPKCGAAVAPEDSLCRVCGAALTAAVQQPRSQAIQQLILEHHKKVNDNPDDESARYSLGLAYLYQGEAAAAAEQFAEVTKLVPDFAEGYGKLAIALAKMRKYREARQSIEQARKLQPNNEEYRKIAERLAQLS